LLSTLRHRRARIALATVLASLALPAAAAHADLLQGQPTNVTGGYFDDHSIGGDDHLGWGYTGTAGTSDSEPLAINFGTTLTNSSGSPFRVCGYPSGTAGWMRAHEASGTAACPGTAPGTQDGWFRYITANHHGDATPPTFNRWHLMDLQRFALVPLPTSAGGPAGASTAWDTYWGTCLADSDPTMACQQAAGAGSLNVSIAAGQTKTTQEQNPAPDAQRIAIPTSALGQFPDGLYQVVAVANPYGAYSGPASYACTTIRLSGVAAYAPSVTQVAGVPSTCWVPSGMLQALSGPGGRDPMAGAQTTTPACPLMPATGHCWATVPTSGANRPARTNITAANTVTPTSTVPVAYGPSPTPPPSSGASNPPASGAGNRVNRRLTAALSRTYTRTALRSQFGPNLSRLRISCRVRTSTASTCRVSWRKSGATYKGNVWLRYRTVRNRLRWQYRLEVKKRKSGRTQTVRRAYRTGGTF
jgi:hypothetical protein